jgi:tetratricopeptide (TPR) repeat protein
MTMYRLSQLICLLLGTAALGTAGPTPFEQAGQHFKTGDFAAAADAYEHLLTTEGPRAAVFYNLGNCYQRLGQFGPAILAYERARLLSPRDPDLLVNLALARKAAAAFEEPGVHPRLDGLLNHLSRNEWSWLVAAAALVLGALTLVCGAAPPPRRWLRTSAWVAAGIAGSTIATGAAALYLRHGEATRGIVLSAAATVRLSPFESAEALGTPGPGRSVRLGAHTGAFRYVEVPATHLRGWMADTDVAAVIPERTAL